MFSKCSFCPDEQPAILRWLAYHSKELSPSNKGFQDFLEAKSKVLFCSASLVAQLIKDPPAMWKAWVRSLGLEHNLKTGKATHSSILDWRIPQAV